MWNRANPGVNIMVEEAFKKYYGKLFAEDKAKDQIKWHGSSMSSLMAQLRRHPSWTGFKYLRSELKARIRPDSGSMK
jgi:hypothetical protein